MAKTLLHAEGESSAQALIRAGHYDMSAPWSFSAEDGNAMLGPKGNDWDKYGRWHLGEDAGEPDDTRAHWKYPYGKGGKVYRRALASIRSRASQAGDTAVFEAAGRLISAMDDEEDKKESNVSLKDKLFGSTRFSHFAPAAETEEDDDAKRAAAARKKAQDDEEEARRAKEEEEEEARRAKSRKRGRKGRRARSEQSDDDDEDGDDAADDDEEDDDDDEMKKASAAGYGAALDAAFRAGARAQRRRCAAVMSHKAAAANPVLAMSLAFETNMNAAAARSLLERAPVQRGASLHDRMAASSAGATRVPPSAPEGPRGEAAVDASWDAALSGFAERAHGH